MMRMILASFVYVLVAGQPALFAQSQARGYGFNPYAPPKPGEDPRDRRAKREKAVAMLGPKAREMVETYGEDAVAAIFACSVPVSLKLVDFFNNGEMAKLPRPKDLLRVIANPRHRDDVAIWAIMHSAELADTDSFDAYVFNPLEYALGLKSLETGAAESRANRLYQNAAATQSNFTLSVNDRQAMTIGVVILGLLIVCYRKRRN